MFGIWLVLEFSEVAFTGWSLAGTCWWFSGGCCFLAFYVCICLYYLLAACGFGASAFVLVLWLVLLFTALGFTYCLRVLMSFVLCCFRLMRRCVLVVCVAWTFGFSFVARFLFFVLLMISLFGLVYGLFDWLDFGVFITRFWVWWLHCFTLIASAFWFDFYCLWLLFPWWFVLFDIVLGFSLLCLVVLFVCIRFDGS